MQIVVTLSEREYALMKSFIENGMGDNVMRAICNGQVLPKGHGRLVDADKLKTEMECGIRAGNLEEGYEKYQHILDMDGCVEAVAYADTIIEADKENEE